MGWALITGASSGLGREFAKLAAADGWNLVISARRTDELNALAAELATDVVVIPADLAESGAGIALWEKASEGRDIDLLVNNAGFGAHGKFAKGDAARERASVMVNVAAFTELLQCAVTDFRARKVPGKVLNLASLAGFFPSGEVAVYHATKAYVLALVEGVRADLRGTGITVTALCPGPTRTEFFSSASISDVWLTRFLPMQSAAKVARIGWDAMKRGKGVTLTGPMHSLVAFSSRFQPRALQARMNAFFWSKRP